MKKLPPSFVLAVLFLFAGVSLSSALDVTARYFRFTQTKLRDNVSANSIQMAEFDMLFQGTRIPGAAATNPGGNNPTGEIPANVVDQNTGSKWLDFNKGTLVLDFGAAVTADGYRFATANDATERDPVSWHLEASDDNLAWSDVETKTDFPTPLARVTYTPNILFLAPIPLTINDFSTSRPNIGAGESATLSWNVVGSATVTIDPGVGTVAESGTIVVSPATDTVYTLTATKDAETVTQQTAVKIIATGPHTAQYFRFTQTRLRGVAPNSIQLAEFEMTRNGVAVTGATATNPGGSNGVGETAAQAVDGSLTTKWLDLAKGPLVLTFPTPVEADGYRFATANDFDERDPLDWTLEAGTDGIAWTVYDTVTGFPTPLARMTYTGIIPLPGLLPPSAALTVSPVHLLPGESATLTWTTEGATTVTITPAVPNGDTPGGTAIVTPTGPTTYTLTATNAVGTATKTVRVQVEGVAQQATWKFFRFTPTNLRDSVLANSVQLAEFELSLNRIPVTGATASNVGGDNPAGETPDKAVDGDINTKWLDRLKGTLTLEFPAPVTVDGYRLATANDSPERDPFAWTVAGSNDGTAWTVFDTRDIGFVVPETRFAYTNFFHFAGTLPEEAEVPVTLIVYDPPSNTVTIVWDSELSRTYRVETTFDFVEWITASDNIVPEGTTTAQTFPVTGDKLFFRVIRKK